MRIGIISNSDILIPLTYALAAQKLQVYIFLSGSHDTFSALHVHEFAKQHHIPVREEKSGKTDLYEWINWGKYDACFILGYSHKIILSKVNVPHDTLFNIHFSSLPSYKGPSPVFWQLKEGVKKLGITIHQLTERFDDGPVVWQKEYLNHDFFDFEAAYRYLGNMCIEGVFVLLQLIGQHIPLVPVKIPAKTQSYQTRPKAGDVMIRWESMTALEICNLVRACSPWNKGAITTYHNNELKLMDAVLVNDVSPAGEHPGAGSIVEDEGYLMYTTSDGKILQTNTIFYRNSFIPAYRIREWGILKNNRMDKPDFVS